jgi:polyferredoxin
LTQAPSGSDVLRWPVIGRFLRWRHARTTLQCFLLLAAGVVVLHGLLGPQIAPINLATVLIWVHYRGLLVIVLLAAGNFFCMGCPFVLVRDAGRRVRPPWLRWPRGLRTKWIGIALFVAVLFVYELSGLWALPRATAYLVLAYFGAALAIDLVFSGATFCKYLCPIGQFNFVASTVSPLELRVRQPETCRTCRTVDCIKGRRQPGAPHLVTQRGCELRLFQPLKVGNMDCTFCLDCVQACPHDNVALATRVPGAELFDGRRRSGIGRFEQRPDIAALVVVFAFGGMLNALGMVKPVYGLERWLSRAMGGASQGWVLGLLFVLGLGVVPLVFLGGAAALTKLVARDARSIGAIAVHYLCALVPFGLGVWLAHYGFHLLTGALTIIPVVQSAVIDLLGWAALGAPRWRWTGMRPGMVFPIQLGLILLGTIGSLTVAYRISEREYPDRPGRSSAARTMAPWATATARWATAPWAVVIVALASIALWILSQPMEMRGISLTG